jgi:hypothetical protein
VTQSQFFLIDTRADGDEGDPVLARGARIRIAGGDADVASVGLTVRGASGAERDVPPEFSFAGPAGESSYLRLSGKAAIPGALPLPDGRFGPEGRLDDASETEPDGGRSSLEARTRLLREWDPPGFYDEGPGATTHRVVFDKLFILAAPGVGLRLAGGPGPVSAAPPPP